MPDAGRPKSPLTLSVAERTALSQLAAAPRTTDAMRLRARIVLASAEGRSNKAIGEQLAISQGAVQKTVSTIFNKLGLPAGEDDDRRILAVLAYLRPEL